LRTEDDRSSIAQTANLEQGSSHEHADADYILEEGSSQLQIAVVEHRNQVR